ncbi:hypothetical protein COY48_02000 [Candidatus Collierbacteria bacterium CG_4_10_14_0_8_um_filter_43_86]|nr:MAG: hypothetical protein COY48_02000 [Candidatus Collierbacteria bacterium CG_4_10_14_0_8_um_filter_43_86]
MANPDPKDLEDIGRDYYVSANGIVSSTPQEAVTNSLQFENTSNTGAGCSQAPENVITSNEE